MKHLIFYTLFIVGIVSSKTPEKAENFSLNDINGKKVTLADFKDSKAIVLMFISIQCPVSNAYNDRMAELFNDYNKKDVAIIGINSNKAESADEIKDHAQEHMLAFTILKDVNNVVADQLDANHTPEIYVVHPKTMEVLYHGRIDDSQREAKITSRDLRTALDEILSGKQVTSKETKAFGCSIKRVK